MEFVGLIPAAGLAKRLGEIPCSKEVMPLKSTYAEEEKKKVFSEFLLEAYREGGIKKVHFILRKGKWDIPTYYGNGAEHGLTISYLLMQYPYGVPFTLYEACPFIEDKIVALGFPDIIFTPKNAFEVLCKKIMKTGADLVLGLFPIKTKEKWDMVETDASGKVVDIKIKQSNVNLTYGWTLAVWGPQFTNFFKETVETHIRRGNEGKVRGQFDELRELYPGDVFLQAIKKGLKVDCVTFEEGKCIDLGTREDLNAFRNSFGDWEIYFD